MKQYLSKSAFKSNPTLPKLYSNERYYPSKLNHDEYLTDLSCERIHNILRQNYFNRVDNASLKNFLPKYLNASQSKNIPSANTHRLPAIPASLKKLALSNKIRVKNMSRINKQKQMSKSGVHNNEAIPDKSNEEEEEFKKEIEENDKKGIRKAKLPKLAKKKVIDPFPLIYETKYIDKVEDKFIKPYYNDNNEFYTEFVENKKSKIPLLFMLEK